MPANDPDLPLTRDRTADISRHDRADTNSGAADESSLDPDHTAGPGTHRAQAPEGVAGYELLSELGRGGMGVVYEARHLKLNRVVALKTMLGGPVGRGDLIRFLAEAEAVAAVRHENVVLVYECPDRTGGGSLPPGTTGRTRIRSGWSCTTRGP